jgi:methanogenic corrinoid protein MtbC1
MATRGGRRQGAGRKPGSLSKKTREIAEKASEEGITPLEYMLGVMRDATADTALRFEAAKAAAPYIHPRLASIEQKTEVNLTQKVISAEPLDEEEFIKQYAGGMATPVGTAESLN